MRLHTTIIYTTILHTTILHQGTMQKTQVDHKICTSMQSMIYPNKPQFRPNFTLSSELSGQNVAKANSTATFFIAAGAK
jgi:hypothetical protein